VLEGAAFWDGVRATPANGALLQNAAVVVLPAWLEDQPRRLLLAVAAGVSVIASEACGLEGTPGVTSLPTGDMPALHNAIAAAGLG